MRHLLVLLVVVIACVTAFASTAGAHQDGCHRWHSCPSDTGSYVCGDLGYFDYCGYGPTTDTDGDGVLDINDACRTTFAQTATGCPAPAAPAPAAPAPPADSDGDGITDVLDACPTTAASTASGCPTPVATTVKPYEIPVAAPCKVRGALPDPHCTPGATFRVTAAQVCKRGYSRRVRNVPSSLKDKVYARYGIKKHTAATYEVDHLISLELGGSNSIKNLFPEAANPRPGFHEKDRLENRLHTLVCDGSMSLRSAQRQIAKNWLKPYHRLFG